MPDENNRIEIVDALRGFALAGIVLVHFVEQFIGGLIPEEQQADMLQGIPDYVVSAILQIFFIGKFFALFSILFGLSFFIQMDRAAMKGQPYRWRFIWRLLVLLIFGLLHSLFYRGDILTVYVIVGFFLPLFYHVPNRWILGVAVLLFLGLGRFVVFTLHGADSFFGLAFMEQNSEFSKAYFKILSEGTIWEVFKDNITSGVLVKLDFQFGTFNRGYLTFGLFLIGMWFGRINLFHKLHTWKHRIKDYMWYALAFGLVCLVAVVVQFTQIAQPVNFNSLQTMIAMQTADLMNLGLTGFILFGFLIVYLGKRGKQLKVFVPYGRMALTNYLLQSLIGTAIFYGWGLGFIAEVRNLYTFLFGFFIIFLQVLYSRWWLTKFNYGPLEWLWRCLTWWRWMPMRKNAII